MTGLIVSAMLFNGINAGLVIMGVIFFADVVIGVAALR